MQKELEKLAKEMQKLEPKDRLYWLQSMAHCLEIACPRTYPTYKSLSQIDEDFRRFKGILIRSLSEILAGKKEETLVVKNGVNAFMSLTKEEREEFYKVVQTEPYKSEKSIALSDHRKRHISKHGQKVKVVIFDPSGRVRTSIHSRG